MNHTALAEEITHGGQHHENVSISSFNDNVEFACPNQDELLLLKMIDNNNQTIIQTNNHSRQSQVSLLIH